MRRLLVLSLAIAFLCPALAWSGGFDAEFEAEFGAASSTDVLQAAVFLKETFDARAVSKSMAAARFTRAQRHEEVVLGLKETADAAQEPVMEFLDSFGSQVKKTRGYWIANVIEVHATKEVFAALAARDDVKSIRAAGRIELVEPIAASAAAGAGKGIEPGIATSRAPELWAKGINGSTALAGDMDTGADGDHDAFASRWRGLDAGVDPSAAWFDPLTTTDFPFDAGSHGSHTLGTMVGDDGGDNQIGMAPGAKWIAAGVIDRGGMEATKLNALAAFEWFADPDGDPATVDDVPDVINNSWGISPIYHGVDDCDDYFWTAIDGAEAAGVVVVFAAGNEGTYGAGSLRTPSDRNTTPVSTFSVGALNQDGTTNAYFSSQGPSGCDDTTVKPEIAAVGVDVRSAYGNGTYGTMSGTSMATPHVAGAVVLLRDAFPDATVDDVKYALHQSAVDLGDPGEDNIYGNGRLDVVEAFYWLCNNGYGDTDADGHLIPLCDGDDCDDTNPAIFTGAPEVCNGIDDNCDLAVDEGGNTLCDDAQWCNGFETCGGAAGCLAGTEACTDDMLFCTGIESCNEELDQCESSGDPCAADGLYCNGTESCDEKGKTCVSSGDPCGDGEECDEDGDTCDDAEDDDDGCGGSW